MDTYRETQFQALGDATRQRIVEQLADGPLPVGKLAAKFTVSRPAISQHLRVLERADLVEHRTSGTRRVYQLNPRGILSLRDYIDGFWTRALDGFKKKVEEVSEEGEL
ncbi:MAG TPA: metalloregulator ArsR/SmtB family transcription factor [Bryobacteraceae bacterium]|nr:metalloregulator ArsR/SmtB family transcription factor [Bryobacteraceae bacterium]